MIINLHNINNNNNLYNIDARRNAGRSTTTIVDMRTVDNVLGLPY